MRRVMELSGDTGVGAEETGTSGCGALSVSRCEPEADRERDGEAARVFGAQQLEGHDTASRKCLSWE